ncbi:efflux RND transporter periplasmic adaptor subunit, partial [bacterium]|nr:efflux RND transporter periplasmic adaptor subunit [bacterium]
MKRILITLLAVIGIVIFSTGCGDKTADKTVKNAVPVEKETVTTGSVNQSLSFDGDVFAEYEVKVFSKIPDRIENFHVDEGDVVRKGQSLAQIYAETIKQGVRQAKAGLTAAKAQAANVAVEYQRAKRLYNESAMSKQQYDALQTQYEATNAQMEQAEAALISAKSGLNDATISAPISGIIGNRYFEEGDMASPAMPLLTVVQMDRVKITFSA